MRTIQPIGIQQTPVNVPVSASVNYDGDHDQLWDEFVLRHSAGNHLQTMPWGKAKRHLGCSIRQIVLRRGDKIIGGAVMLLRKTPWPSVVGYISRGPIFAENDVFLAKRLFEKLRELAAADRVSVLLVQPPVKSDAVSRYMRKIGFCSSPIRIGNSATVIIDLHQGMDCVLARMSKSKRNNIRRSQRRGIEVCRGTFSDLPEFYRLFRATSVRRGFRPFSLEYFEYMWRVMHPHDMIQLFIAKFQGEPVAAQLVISFGDTITATQFGWSGAHRNRLPTDALDWAIMLWAKERGYRYYDLDGIEAEAADALIAGKPLPKSFVLSPTGYKVRTGGQVHRFSDTFCYFPNDLWHIAFRFGGARLARLKIAKKAINHIRSG